MTITVMFWNEANEAILFGTTCKFDFENREQADNFVSGIDVPNASSVSFQDKNSLEVYEVIQ